MRKEVPSNIRFAAVSERHIVSDLDLSEDQVQKKAAVEYEVEFEGQRFPAEFESADEEVGIMGASYIFGDDYWMDMDGNVYDGSSNKIGKGKLLKDGITASLKKKAAEDVIPGGLADKMEDTHFDPIQLEMGTIVEMEHTDDPAKAKEVAKDHLMEDKEYYTKLDKMESGEVAALKKLKADWIPQDNKVESPDKGEDKDVEEMQAPSVKQYTGMRRKAFIIYDDFSEKMRSSEIRIDEPVEKDELMMVLSPEELKDAMDYGWITFGDSGLYTWNKQASLKRKAGEDFNVGDTVKISDAYGGGIGTVISVSSSSGFIEVDVEGRGPVSIHESDVELAPIQDLDDIEEEIDASLKKKAELQVGDKVKFETEFAGEEGEGEVVNWDGEIAEIKDERGRTVFVDKGKIKEAMRKKAVSPPGWESTVKKMKKHKEIDNPWALSWWMKNKGYIPHKK